MYHSSSSNAVVFKRANKNRPTEIPFSSQPISPFVNVFQVKKKHCRDPRFDDLSGSFSKDKFEENYLFLQDVREKEKKQLEKELEETKNSKRKKKILDLLKRMKNQEVTKKLNEKREREKNEAREAVIKSLQEGKKPYIMKKSEEKRQNLTKLYKDLKQSGKLQKYLEKKRKKMTSKDRKRFPS